MNFPSCLLLLFENESSCTSCYLKMRLVCMKINMREKHTVIHMNDLARRLVFTGSQPDFLEGYNNKRYLLLKN